jgi:hypothetical protein
MSDGVEAPVWHTSRELIKSSPGSFRRLDQAGLDAVFERLSHSMVEDYLREHEKVPVYLHTGDLTIDGSFANQHVVVVDGNLTIRGSYDDYVGGHIGILVVLGDMRVEHVVSWGSIAVSGALEASGLVYAYYNDFTFEVRGLIKARALLVVEKSGAFKQVDALIVQTDERDDTALALRHFMPELMIESLLESRVNADEEDEDGEDEDNEGADEETPEPRAKAGYSAAGARVVAGEPIFRDRAAPESLIADLRHLLAPKVTAATMTRLASTDRLLAMVVAANESVPIEVQRQFAEAGDAAILELMAANPNADPAVLAQIAGTNGETAANVIRNPNAPPDAIASLMTSSDPAVRIALIDHARVEFPVDVLSSFAADEHAAVRTRLAADRSLLPRLPPADLARLVADPEADVRVFLARHEGVLNFDQLAVLARDESVDVRKAVAEALSHLALGEWEPIGAPDACAALVTTLLGDAAPAVRLAAVRGASAAEQEQFVAKLPDAERSRVEFDLVQYTRSAALMARAADGELKTARLLASNLAITPDLQDRLIARLPEAATRTRFDDLDWREQFLLDSWDTVIDALVRNPNATPQALLAVARYCRAANEPSSFCRTLLERDDLPADVLAELNPPTPAQ